MDYLNNTTYSRGQEVTLRFAMEAGTARTEKGMTYQATLSDSYGASGHYVRLVGGAPEVRGDGATVTLTGKVEGVPDGEYKTGDGVQGRVPGGTVLWEPFFWPDGPLGVKGGVGSD